MQVRIALGVVLIGCVALLRASSVEACSCAGRVSSSTAFNGADLVFVGTIAQFDGPKPWSRVNADGSISGGLGTEPRVWTFEVAQMFRGGPARQVVVTGVGCDPPFKQGETWLVYAHTREGRVTTDTCTRTRPRAEAGQDLVYLEGQQQGRRQGIVYGEVLRRILDADGKPALQALFEPLQVIAIGAGRRVEITTDKWGPYQLVLPPGEYEIWVERAGRAVAPRQAVPVDDGSDWRLLLPVEYKN